jgi:prepilin-type N-terminal cleavage/methylation domain-containing protein
MINRINHLGFTIIELLIVISVIGFLSGIAIITAKFQIDKGYDARRKNDLYSLKTAFEDYYNDHSCYPTISEWNSAQCNSTSTFLTQYSKSFPCDPNDKQKYYYETTDKDGNHCEGKCGNCVGYRLLAKLKTANPEIVAMGCDLNSGCGVSAGNGNNPNWGIAMGTTVAMPGFIPAANTNTDKSISVNSSCQTENAECLINSSAKKCCTGLLCIPYNPSSENGKCQKSGSTPTPTPSLSPTLTLTLTPTPTPPVNCLPAPNPEPTSAPFVNLTYDTGNCPSDNSNDFVNLIYYENGLEWYKWENGGYPDCNCESWEEAEKCITAKISKYTSKLPKSGSLPFLYRPYDLAGGKYQNYCLAAPYAGCPVSNYKCPLTGMPNYNLYRKGRGEIIWHPNGNNLTQPLKTYYDNKRKLDLESIKNVFEKYKSDHGYYPQVTYENSPGSILSVRSQLQPTYLNPMPFLDPTGHTYSITEWNKDNNGKFTHYCIDSYMDDNNNCANNCNNWHPFYDTYYCYGIGN